MTKKGLSILLFLLTVSAVLLFAYMEGGDYAIPFSVFDSWGEPRGYTGGDYTLSGSLGEMNNTVVSGGDYQIDGGFYASLPMGRTACNDLSAAHSYPVPFKPYEGHRTIKFTKLTNIATIRIYTLSGELVKTIEKQQDGLDEVEWNVKNDAGEDVFSGVYIYTITAGDAIISPKKNKLIIIR
jgi:hypothetical protein